MERNNFMQGLLVVILLLGGLYIYTHQPEGNNAAPIIPITGATITVPEYPTSQPLVIPTATPNIVDTLSTLEALNAPPTTAITVAPNSSSSDMLTQMPFERWAKVCYSTGIYSAPILDTTDLTKGMVMPVVKDTQLPIGQTIGQWAMIWKGMSGRQNEWWILDYMLCPNIK